MKSELTKWKHLESPTPMREFLVSMMLGLSHSQEFEFGGLPEESVLLMARLAKVPDPPLQIDRLIIEGAIDRRNGVIVPGWRWQTLSGCFDQWMKDMRAAQARWN